MTHSLPPQGPHEPDDLIPGEAELRAIYGKLPRNEPGPALDAAVLRAAAEAVSSQRDVTSSRPTAAPTRRNRPPRWLIGLSSAATLVLAVGLAWRMRSMPQVDSPDSPVQTTDEVSSKTISPSAADASRNNAAAGMLAPSVMPSPPPPHRSVHAARAQASIKALAEQAARKKVATDLPDASRKATGMLSKSAPIASETPSTADKASAPPPHILAAPRAVEPAPVMEVSPPAPPPPVQETSATATAPIMQADELLAQNAVAAEDAELDAIRQLFADHHDEQAQRRLETFHRLHPDWKLAPDLQARLRKP